MIAIVHTNDTSNWQNAQTQIIIEERTKLVPSPISCC